LEQVEQEVLEAEVEVIILEVVLLVEQVTQEDIVL
jgi:hypothetical protein